MGEYVNEVRCQGGCGKLLLRTRDNDQQLWSMYKMVEGVALCLPCAAAAAEKRLEPVKIRPKTIEDYPAVMHDQQTVISWLQYNEEIGANAVQILMAHALATKDIDTWLDTLHNPSASFEAQQMALKHLRATASDWRDLCGARDEVMHKIEAFEHVYRERELKKEKKEKAR